tara:strand:- start:228 stop:470 length:243 start_codon:yes stop_codon:yes gene_type:complete
MPARAKVAKTAAPAVGGKTMKRKAMTGKATARNKIVLRRKTRNRVSTRKIPWRKRKRNRDRNIENKGGTVPGRRIIDIQN